MQLTPVDTSAAIFIPYTPDAAVAAGDVVVIGDLPLISHVALSANVAATLSARGGIYEATGDAAIDAGKGVYWNAAAEKITEDDDGGTNKSIGVTLSACAGDGETCLLHHYAPTGSAPAGGGGGGLSNFTESLNDAAPNETVPVAAFSAYGAEADIDAALVPKGTGAITAQIADGTAAGGDKRGGQAVDFQMSRSASTQVASGAYSAVVSGSSNTASGTYSVVSGGDNNTASAISSAVVSGSSNTASGNHSVVSCGKTNTASGTYSVVSGGKTNTASAISSAVVSGSSNTASGNHSVVSGGDSNTASGSRSVVSGGDSNTASGPHSVVSGGDSNTASGDYSVVSGGYGNTVTGNYSVVGGGKYNTASGAYSVVCGGGYGAYVNTASGSRSVVSGGDSNTASGPHSVVSGGNNNTASESRSVVSGGGNNTASGAYSVVSGGFRATTRGITGMSAIASGRFAADGDAQEGGYRLRTQTTDATANVALTADAGAQSATNQVILPNASTYVIRGIVTAREPATGDSKTWDFTAGIRRGANAASTAMIAACTPTVVAQDAGATAWALDVSADTTNGGLQVRGTGEASHTIQWTASIWTSENVG